eukprot:16218454-Heterocapsa_arctica.AAC.1
MENVLAVKYQQNGICAIDEILKIVRELGYVGDYAVFNTLQYGLPQSRTRVYAVCAKAPFNPLRAISIATTFKFRSLPVTAFLLPGAPEGGDADERSRRPRAWDKAKVLHKNFKKEHNIEVKDIENVFKLYPGLQNKVLTAREREALALHYCILHRDRGIELERSNFVFQVDQNVHRMP